MNVLAEARQRAADAGGGWLPLDAVTALVNGSNLLLHQVMLALLPLARSLAQPRLSRFQVGAVGEGFSGALYFGANIEFDRCPLNQTVHAEQAVVVNAANHGETGLRRLAVTAAPCGHCRQFLYELVSADQLEILVSDGTTQTLASLLPAAFGPRDLQGSSGLLSPVLHRFETRQRTDDELDSAASAAACRSYAPYTEAWAGAAVRVRTGQIFAGPYLENAAFNPSISPLQAALVVAALAGHSLETITAVTIVERQESPIDHTAAARHVLSGLGSDVTVRQLLVHVA